MTLWFNSYPSKTSKAEEQRECQGLPPVCEAGTPWALTSHSSWVPKHTPPLSPVCSVFPALSAGSSVHIMGLMMWKTKIIRAFSNTKSRKGPWQFICETTTKLRDRNVAQGPVATCILYRGSWFKSQLSGTGQPENQQVMLCSGAWVPQPHERSILSS